MSRSPIVVKAMIRVLPVVLMVGCCPPFFCPVDPPRDDNDEPTVSITPPDPIHPTAVNIRIANIPQQTDVWCWAAVAQQIIAYSRGLQQTPAQCALVAIANNVIPGYCCMAPTPCLVTGSLQQIQALIAYFGGRFSTVIRPTDPVTLYRILESGRPVIMATQATPFTGHVIVIRGMEWVPTSGGFVPVLHVNDPIKHFTEAIPFAKLARIWQSAIVVESM